MSSVRQYLAEQQELTAAERFSAAHDGDELLPGAKLYSTLLPADLPGKGQQFAFEVDLDACTGCKACVTACHSLNGLEENETWRDVGLLHGGTSQDPVIQHVTSACHHCLEPACLKACPVDAYEKDPVTGIVIHLDDQCFGCQYCTLACPYDVPKYIPDKGIVRKCDMCVGRLSVGEAPACVQGCPQHAIRITTVDVERVVEESETNTFLPGAPEPDITLPTTTYKTARAFPRNMLPADYYTVRRADAHWPLIVMLVLTQLSVGAFLVEFLLGRLFGTGAVESLRPLHSASAVFFGLLALGASICHLGRPRYAYRAVIGLRHSWLSREIVAFGLFALLATAYAAALWLEIGSARLLDTLGAAVVVAGLSGVLCSVMVYKVTRRAFWAGSSTALRFALSTALLGIAAACATLTLLAVVAGPGASSGLLASTGTILLCALIAVAATKLVFEALFLRHLGEPRTTPLKRSAIVMTHELGRVTLARFALGFLGGLWMPGFLLLSGSLTNADFAQSVLLSVIVAALFAACLVGEFLERYLFFTAATAPGMPGTLR